MSLRAFARGPRAAAKSSRKGSGARSGRPADFGSGMPCWLPALARAIHPLATRNDGTYCWLDFSRIYWDVSGRNRFCTTGASWIRGCHSSGCGADSRSANCCGDQFDECGGRSLNSELQYRLPPLARRLFSSGCLLPHPYGRVWMCVCSRCRRHRRLLRAQLLNVPGLMPPTAGGWHHREVAREFLCAAGADRLRFGAGGNLAGSVPSASPELFPANPIRPTSLLIFWRRKPHPLRSSRSVALVAQDGGRLALWQRGFLPRGLRERNRPKRDEPMSFAPSVEIAQSSRHGRRLGCVEGRSLPS